MAGSPRGPPAAQRPLAAREKRAPPPPARADSVKSRAAPTGMGLGRARDARQIRSAPRLTFPGLAAEAGGEEEKDGEQHGGGGEQNRVHPAGPAPPTSPLVRPVPFLRRKAPRARAAPGVACGGGGRRER